MLSIFFMCLFVIYVASLVKYLLKSLAHFLIGMYIFLLLSFGNYLFWIHILYQICDLQKFPSVNGLIFHSLNGAF